MLLTETPLLSENAEWLEEAIFPKSNGKLALVWRPLITDISKYK